MKSLIIIILFILLCGHEAKAQTVTSRLDKYDIAEIEEQIRLLKNEVDSVASNESDTVVVDILYFQKGGFELVIRGKEETDFSTLGTGSGQFFQRFYLERYY
jgi:hypothetical protein